MKQKQKKTNKTKKKNDEKKLPKQNLQCKKEWPILNMYISNGNQRTTTRLQNGAA